MDEKTGGTSNGIGIAALVVVDAGFNRPGSARSGGLAKLVSQREMDSILDNEDSRQTPPITITLIANV